ncbi:GspE/PulE family protein [Quatrionicoccus australiensis]|uniref:GspE/PulE family protein n=1 Tax=Quatrionicoccus australiensis TaxID=138118 RepID=UPI001CFA4AAB|nr:GspE/PulE family protein [Quatrionicoccus australiensis]MCB4361764.1 type II/IV secretion system protein [Quatrionicoccus australiensis]
MNARLPDPPESDYPLASAALLQRLVPAFDRLSLADAMARRCVLFRDSLAVDRYFGVISDPLAERQQRWAEARAELPVVWHLASAADLAAWLEQQAAGSRLLAEPEAEGCFQNAAATSDKTLSVTQSSAQSSPVVRLLNATLHDALRLGASDVHLESSGQGLDIRYRIDGVLEHIRSVRGVDVAPQVISRLKVLAELDIAETRIPQDGRLTVRLGEGQRRIDLRVSIMPSLHGEDGVLRILDKSRLMQDRQSLTLEGLGFAAEDMRRLRDLAAQPYGMLLASGPTGSGKTTSLYAVLSEIHDGREKIITIEDPVEYQLPGVLQIPVNEKKGLTFARGLRSILRHDPDTIMVGEIRDRETAEIAIQSALTGHRVLSTLHANHVFDVFGRFSHMGIDPYLLTSAISGVWAQRLVRSLCPACAGAHQPTPQQIDELQLSGDSGRHGFKKAVGCPACRGTGYQGRSAIVEILALDDVLRTLIAQRAPLSEIRSAARAQGVRNLRDAALALAAQGKTTLEEVRRVTARH